MQTCIFEVKNRVLLFYVFLFILTDIVSPPVVTMHNYVRSSNSVLSTYDPIKKNVLFRSHVCCYLYDEVKTQITFYGSA